MKSNSLPFVEIFKIDSEISTRSNGVPGTRELQVKGGEGREGGGERREKEEGGRERERGEEKTRAIVCTVLIVMHCPFQPFEFDSTAGEDNTVQDNLIDGSNWAPEEMFDTNKEKACVGGVVECIGGVVK